MGDGSVDRPSRADRWTGEHLDRPDGVYEIGAGLGLPSGTRVVVRDGLVIAETYTGPGTGGEIDTCSVKAARIQRGWAELGVEQVVVLGED